MINKISLWTWDDNFCYLGFDSTMKTIKLTNDEARELKTLLVDYIDRIDNSVSMTN